MNTGVHGRSAVSASRRLRVTMSAGRTSLVTSHAHSRSRHDASSSRVRPGQGGSGALCRVRMAAPAAAHAAGDAVEGSQRWPTASPGRAASASAGGLFHRIFGVGIGTIDIAPTSTSVRVGSPSIFTNTSPTRSVARSSWATTIRTFSTSAIIAGSPTIRRVHSAPQHRLPGRVSVAQS